VPRAGSSAPAGGPGWLTTLGMIVLYLAFINRPLINLAYSAYLGLLTSTLSTTTRRAASLAMVVQVFVIILAAALVAWPGWREHLSLLLGPGAFGERLTDVYVSLLPLGLITLARLLLAPALFALAVLRVEHWPD
jgi:hypothetical protein